MSKHRGLTVYRRLLRCYPRSFRETYGDDMVLLVSELLDHEPALRVWARSLVDLAITVPARHLEAHMQRSARSFVPALFAAVSVAALLIAVIAGTNSGVVIGGAVVAAVATFLAVAAARSSRTVTAPAAVTAQWWRLLAVGLCGLALMIVAEQTTDLSLWTPMVFTVLLSLVLVAAGVVLGVVHVVTAHSRRSIG